MGAVLQFADLKACNEGVLLLQLWGIGIDAMTCSSHLAFNTFFLILAQQQCSGPQQHGRLDNNELARTARQHRASASPEPCSAYVACLICLPEGALLFDQLHLAFC